MWNIKELSRIAPCMCHRITNTASKKDKSQPFWLFNFFFFFLAAPAACGSSQARDQTHATAVTGIAAVTTPDSEPAVPQGNSSTFQFFNTLAITLMSINIKYTLNIYILLGLAVTEPVTVKYICWKVDYFLIIRSCLLPYLTFPIRKKKKRFQVLCRASRLYS